MVGRLENEHWYMIHLYDMNIYTGDIDTIL